MPPTTIYLIRHAETTWNAEGRLQGTLDAPLSARGQRQVQGLARALGTLRLAAVYSSPLGRALETARPLAEACGLVAEVVPDLREMDQGDWEGRRVGELQAEKGERIQAWWDTPDQTRLPGGESLEEVAARGVRALEGVIARHRGQAVAVVAHGGVNKTLLLWALGAPLASHRRIRQGNACLNILEVDEAGSRVVLLNGTAHLPP